MKHPEQPYRPAIINDATLLQKGMVGKTDGPLVGCIAPVILYRTSAILGHFGVISFNEAQQALKKCIQERENPTSVLLFRRAPIGSGTNDQHYEDNVNRMRELVAKIVNIPAQSIAVQTYRIRSEVIVDWQVGDSPSVYVQKLD